MLKKDDLYKQSLNDLLRIVIVLAEILEEKELTSAENERISYGTKVLKNVTEKQIILN